MNILKHPLFRTRKRILLLTIVIAPFMILGWSIYFGMRHFVIERFAESDARKASVVNLRTCLNPTDQLINNTVPVITKDDRIFVCGTLVTEEKITLSIYWLSLPGESVVYQNPYDESYSSGYFYSELDRSLSAGDYRVDIYYQRVLLNSVTFTITDN